MNIQYKSKNNTCFIVCFNFLILWSIQLYVIIMRTESKSVNSNKQLTNNKQCLIFCSYISLVECVFYV